MPLAAGVTSRASARSRLLAYGLLGFCTIMMLFGPIVAETVLAALGCSTRPGLGAAGCSGMAMLPGSWLSHWLSVAPPLETTFVLLEHAWPALLVWLACIVLSMRFDRAPVAAGIEGPADEPPATSPDVPAAPSPPFAEQQPEWIRRNQAEQAALLRAEQFSLHQRLKAEGTFWGLLSTALLVLVVGLATFCLTFGTPVIGGLSADSLLGMLACRDLAHMEANPWSGVCGFLVDRLEPYGRPWYGALFAPLWLFSQFSDVLLVWLGIILLLAFLPGLRIGGRALFGRVPAAASIGFVVVSCAALWAQFSGLAAALAPVPDTAGSMGGDAASSVLTALFTFGALFLLALLIALFALLACIATLTRK